MLFHAGRHYYNIGRKIKTLSAEKVFRSDNRKPVIYLRSFDDDNLTKDVPYAHELLFPVHTEEEQLAKAFREIGPFVAIGKAMEPLPELGAGRTYVGDNDWQKKVIELMSDARLVVIRLGVSPGLWWEIEQSVRHLSPQQLILIVPRNIDYENFRKNF